MTYLVCILVIGALFGASFLVTRRMTKSWSAGARTAFSVGMLLLMCLLAYVFDFVYA